MLEQDPTGSPQAMETADSLAANGVASDVPRAVESGALPLDSDRSGRHRRRPRHRRRRGPLGRAAPVPNPSNTATGNSRDASPAPPAPDDGVPPAQGPPCIINWSAQLARAEADLRRAVLVTVVGNITGIATDDLKAVVANAFVLNPTWCFVVPAATTTTSCSSKMKLRSQGSLMLGQLQLQGTCSCTANDGPAKHSRMASPFLCWPISSSGGSQNTRGRCQQQRACSAPMDGHTSFSQRHETGRIILRFA